VKSKKRWPILHDSYTKYNNAPEEIAKQAISIFLEDEKGEIFNNLPIPDYDDTGFIPRPKIEKELKQKVLGRHPVVTVLGDGGNGKTAVVLQTLYGLLESNDHNFDAIVWVSAKSSRLGRAEIERIEDAILNSLEVFEEVVAVFEKNEGEPIERVRQLLADNKVLLVIDNLETILDQSVRDFAADVPGESKLLFTSRVPLGADLTVQVENFEEREALVYLRALISAYNITALRRLTDEKLKHYASRLSFKPLLLKWFALGVTAGLDPARIISNPEIALRFCLENVIEKAYPFHSGATAS
jgi:LuxR family transcriptional regulator, glucitol operon activator